ncbi:MAG: siphovirus Gp157 family protein [Furfurilactobacillus sp.]|jgi:hypothetical protein|uniref:siphovirus Gp157 family protein n=1 Tax=Furfurilactobacillus sp. TaxID=2767911 RepID=UPI0025874885|nr:siphovirus Gp157 family protein [Furfurilactobacillus sp.]MCH4010565.1 siphovirus Gp157 family protein [Furfurilactobacillus sp.]MCH4036457.1 siphovirus Gp157 family protein [Furfurilactobacillus sp.]MCH4114597.1 siphovirus Gp157 family protein [Furfurilactobacillus sp.]MCH4133784.1 siphovirus Gp157 family protein [Furfurilactobacillus sp.]MCI1340179.1 siphovirus Gp157 family protein [Furfurilactobacillus sp.]
MPTLYELDSNYQRVLSLIGEVDDPKMLDDTLEAIAGGIEDKSANYAVVIKETNSTLAKYDAEIKRLQAERKRIANNQKYMKQFLLNSMNLANIKKIESVRGSVRIQKNPVKLMVNDESLLPDKFFTIHEVKELNKSQLKDALKNGLEVNGAHLEQGESLRIS